MGFRETMARALGLKGSIVPLSAGEFPDRPLERDFNDADFLSTFRDDPWPYILLNKVAEQAAQAPLRVGTLDADGEFEAASPDHPIQVLLDQPNPQEDGWGFRYLLILYLEAVGHVPIELARGARGRGAVAELWLHNPGPWRILANPDRSIKGYLYLIEGRQDVRWTPAQMVYLRWPNPNNPWYGQGRLAAVRQEIMAEEYASQRDKRFEKNLGVPPGILSTEMPLGDPMAAELQKRWEQAVGGWRNAGRIAVLGSKTTYQAISQSARDSQWTEQRRHRIETMAAAAGVGMPLLLMQDAKFTNLQGARAELWEGTLQPRLNAVAEMLTRRLLPLLTTEKLVARFDYRMIEALGENDLEAADTAAKWANTGAVTVDEVRARLTLPPHPDKAIGARLIIPSALALSDPALLVQSQELGVQGQQAAMEAPREPEVPTEQAPRTVRAAKAAPSGREPLEPVIRTYRADLGAFFNAQREALRTRQLAKAEARERIVKDAEDLLTAKRFRDRFAAIARPPIETALSFGATQAASSIGVSASFNVTSAKAVEFIGQRLVRVAADVEATTLEAVRGALAEYLADDGQTYLHLQAKLDDLFDGWDSWRSERIARTEIGYAYAAGQAGQYREADVSMVDIVDGDGDEPCAEANGKRWTIDEYEADPLAHPNCTRIAIPVTELDIDRSPEPGVIKLGLPTLEILMPIAAAPRVAVAAPDLSGIASAFGSLQEEMRQVREAVTRPPVKMRREVRRDDRGRIIEIIEAPVAPIVVERKRPA